MPIKTAIGREGGDMAMPGASAVNLLTGAKLELIVSRMDYELKARPAAPPTAGRGIRPGRRRQKVWTI